jgi:hypothetical protein
VTIVVQERRSEAFSGIAHRTTVQLVLGSGQFTRNFSEPMDVIVRATASLQTDQSARAKAFVQIASPLSCDRFC